MLKNIAIVVAFAAVGAGLTYSTMTIAEEASAQMPPQAMPISVAAVMQQETTQWKEFSGRLRAVEDVDIRPRVSGTIEEVSFKEGDIVEKGAKLFIIDLRPFKAQLQQAEANLAAARARADMAASDAKRAKKLLDEKALSQREYDEKNNANKEAQAAVKSGEAALDLAKLNMEYAEVKAPITGRVGRPEITAGNTVQAGLAILTTMQSISPVYADFDIDEQTYLGLMKAVRADNRVQDMPVFMALADETEFKREGRVRSFDNQLKADSGTIRVRAEFDNADGVLTPGLFARIRLGSADRKMATVINDAAIGTDQSKRYVYVVAEDGTVNYRPVVLGDKSNALRVVDQGLQPGEKIIVNGLMRVRPMMKVQPVEVSMETLAPAQAPQETDKPAATEAATTDQPTEQHADTPAEQTPAAP